MKIPLIQKDIVAHLKAAGHPETSRALAARFLRIENGDEETCRRLLGPFLATVPGLAHHPEKGWCLVTSAGAAAPAGTADEDAGSSEPRTSPDGPQSLRDFIAVASQGTGPAGSGSVALVSLLPVLAGEECQEETFPGEGVYDEAGPAGESGAAVLSPDVLQDLIETIGDLTVVCHRVGREIEPLRRLCAAAGVPFQSPVISAAKLGHLLLGLKVNHAAADLAQALGVETVGPDDCRGRARLVAASFLRLTPLLEKRGIDTVEALLEYQDMPAPPLDLSGYAFTAEDLRGLPTGPGVYRFFDRQGRVIYVGKAKNLRLRVGSYFTPASRGAAKGRALLEQVHRIGVDPVSSELEASLLEAALIEEHRPPLNRQFDVHERAAPYGPRLNLVVVLRDAPDGGIPGGGTCTLHLLRQGRYLGRVSGVADGAASGALWESTLDRIAGSYFPEPAGRDSPPAAGAPEGVDIDWQLVGTFVRKYRDSINILDVDECGSPAEAVTRLRVLAAAAIAGAGRTVAR